MSEKFGDLLRKYRNRYRDPSDGTSLTQARLAEDSYISSKTISAWEIGRNTPSKREDILQILPILYRGMGIQNQEDADRLLKVAGFYALESGEIKEIEPEWLLEGIGANNGATNANENSYATHADLDKANSSKVEEYESILPKPQIAREQQHIDAPFLRTWGFKSLLLVVLIGIISIVLIAWFNSNGVFGVSTPEPVPALPEQATKTLETILPSTIIPTHSVTPEPSSITPASDRAGYIVFTSNRHDDNEVYLINPDNGDLFQLTENKVDDHYPEWLSDGHIAFASVSDGGSEFYTVNTDGSDLTVRNADDMRSWSPDRKKVAYLKYRSGKRDLFISDPDGTNEVRITQNDANEWYPLWAPDGESLLFQSERDGNDEIYWAKADGSAEIRLTVNDSKDYVPAWSPDGTKIAFVASRDGNHEIYVMNADGSNQTRLTNDPDEDTSPDWSPDGTKLVFESYRDGNDEIYVMKKDGSNQRNLTKNPAGDTSPDWSP